MSPTTNTKKKGFILCPCFLHAQNVPYAHLGNKFKEIMIMVDRAFEHVDPKIPRGVYLG